MTEEQKDIGWREEISEPKDILKVKPDSEVIFIFQDEGIRRESEDYGASIVFGVKLPEEEETKVWYVKAKNFTLLGQIKTLGKLEGLKAKVKRVGAKRSDTRYSIEKVD